MGADSQRRNGWRHRGKSVRAAMPPCRGLLLVLNAVDHDIAGRRPRGARAVVGPVDSGRAVGIVVLTALNVGIIAHADPRPGWGVHLVEVADDLNRIARGIDLNVEIAVRSAGGGLFRQYLGDGSADIFLDVAALRATLEKLLIAQEFLVVAGVGARRIRRLRGWIRRGRWTRRRARRGRWAWSRARRGRWARRRARCGRWTRRRARCGRRARRGARRCRRTRRWARRCRRTRRRDYPAKGNVVDVLVDIATVPAVAVHAEKERDGLAGIRGQIVTTELPSVGRDRLGEQRIDNVAVCIEQIGFLIRIIDTVVGCFVDIERKRPVGWNRNGLADTRISVDFRRRRTAAEYAVRS